MNTINDELVYKIQKLYNALNIAQKSVNLLEQENSCLKQKIYNLSNNIESYKDCIDFYQPEISEQTYE